MPEVPPSGQEAQETAATLLKALAAVYGECLWGWSLIEALAFSGVRGGERIGSFHDPCGS
jgi:hypothetical protein